MNKFFTSAVLSFTPFLVECVSSKELSYIETLTSDDRITTSLDDANKEAPTIPITWNPNNAKLGLEKLFHIVETKKSDDTIQADPKTWSKYIEKNGFGAEVLPHLFTGLPLVNQFNVEGIGGFYQERTKRTLNQTESFAKINSLNEWDVWSELLFLNGQSERPKDYPFSTNTQGLIAGGSYTFPNQLSVGIGIGLLHSSIKWNKQNEAGSLNGIFAGPYVGCLFEKGYFSLTTLGLYNSYSLSRAYLNSKLTADHSTWDLAVLCEGGFDFKLPAKRTFLSPKAYMNYLSVFEEGYTEIEGDTTSHVKSSHTSFLTMKSLVELRKEFVFSQGGLIIPSVNIGFDRSLSLANKEYTVTSDNTDLPMAKNYTSTGHLIMGAELTGIHSKGVRLSVGYEARLLGKWQMQSGKLSLECSW